MTLRRPPRPWDINNPFQREIFCAALAGITANPEFFGSIMQQSPEEAVRFADAVVTAAFVPRPDNAIAERESDANGELAKTETKS